MAVSVTFQGTPRSSADATTGWAARNITGSITFSVVTDGLTPYEGSGCLAWDHDIENGGLVYDLGAGTNFSDTHVYVRAGCFTASNLALSVPGSGQAGIYIMAEDTSGNRGYWHVGGSDTYFGGFETFVAYIGSAPDTNSGTAPNNTQIRYIGLGFNHTAKSKLTENCFVDVIRTATSGQGLLVTTTASSVATWDDIVTGDEAGYYGVARKVAGSYLLQGPIQFGDASNTCEFSDSQQSVVFVNRAVSSTHYKLAVVGGAATTTNWQDGTKTGSAGIRGSTIRSNGPDFTLDLNDTNIDNLKLYGTTLVGMGVGQTLFPASVSGTGESLNCSWVDCGEVYADVFDIISPTFIDAAGRTLRIDAPDSGGNAVHNVVDATFIACDTPVHHPVAGDYTYSGFSFAGSLTADVENSVNLTSTDSYTLDNINSSGSSYAGQSFTAGANANLVNAAFRLNRSSTGTTETLTAKLWTHSGTYGTSSVPGTLIATSNPVPWNNVPSSNTIWTYFDFPDLPALTSGTLYVITVGDLTQTPGNISIRLNNSTASHGGNYVFGPASESGWTPNAAADAAFLVNVGTPVVVNSADGSNPSTYTNTGDPKNSTYISNAITLTMVVKDESGTVISGAYAYIDDNDSSPYILNTTTNGSGSSHNHHV